MVLCSSGHAALVKVIKNASYSLMILTYIIVNLVNGNISKTIMSSMRLSGTNWGVRLLEGRALVQRNEAWKFQKSKANTSWHTASDVKLNRQSLEMDLHGHHQREPPCTKSRSLFMT